MAKPKNSKMGITFSLSSTKLMGHSLEMHIHSKDELSIHILDGEHDSHTIVLAEDLLQTIGMAIKVMGIAELKDE